MAKAELGTKRQCQSCGAKFYDLSRDPIICPKCSAVFVVEATVRPRRARPDANGAAKANKAKVKPVEAVDEVGADADLDEVAAVEEEEADAFIEDASELGEDDADVADVVERDVEGGDDPIR